jgi:hypothetical protein
VASALPTFAAVSLLAQDILKDKVKKTRQQAAGRHFGNFFDLWK